MRTFTVDEQMWKGWDRKAQKEGQRHTVYWPTGEQYTGSWKDNKRHGKGTVIYKNGDKYEGDWENGLRHGLGTLWIFLEGKYVVRYNGGWHRDRPAGNGVFFGGEGELYEGDFSKGRRSGRGRQTIGGRPVDGFGGTVYEGEWDNDMKNGRGTLTKPNGDVFEGMWKDNMRHGRGTYYFTEKGMRYDGVWENDVAKCGTYSEIEESPPGARGTIPVLEVLDPGQVLKDATAAALAAVDGDAMAATAVEGEGSSGGEAVADKM
uniref:MORN repeat-containing protein 3 n=1 Tax=Tetraselmis sp. GSL018 TaxID=582737 RepID=A0A061SQ16_9CHLO|mmetsp:Transcript_33310/g.78998  ORF Transcript_33310/g.78998 Transcript_33310/m.78998 type:complete len:262 (+) Transcript_33310:148-933(+)|eukprot:CAMPEP_0177578052 /NCGR_PEP_ID=MMETSP0419_2-20121207/121_1 /TAXON_ID=582737 /ORGANISM="Tetraselmis sp., Strain GSL018" /LENGTH=261 /DNA_ID=CAMNT_0019066427 /DNA_START=87 /DNA_END=872 /DNA_ORIENTATION=-